jgi:hypothetical protein
VIKAKYGQLIAQEQIEKCETLKDNEKLLRLRLREKKQLSGELETTRE